MEQWNIGNKLVVLLFVVALTYFTIDQPSRWLIFYFLVYVAVNLVIQIIRSRYIRQFLIWLTIAYLLVCSIYIGPSFILLLPFNIFELAADQGRRRRGYLLLLLLPLWVVHKSDGVTLLLQYGLIVLLSLFNYLLLGRLCTKVNKQEEQLDQLRHSQDQLRRKLHENEEFIRVSEYTYKLEERNRLSQEIHDGVGHSMTGSLIQMEAAKRVLHAEPASAEQLLQNAIGISKEAIEQIRHTLKNMKPTLQQLGIQRLKTLVEAFGSQSGLVTSVVHSGDLELITPLHWKIIHENVTEALTNTAKYAEATIVHVEIRVLGKMIKAVVHDNGRGKDKIVKGLGLIGMEERTAAVNGTIIADGAKGFSVTTLIPITGETPQD
ncbi:sensor histidine kinase [Paenibacillus aceti]|uniref:histidine kinase n=1 Tax=Paenibacillus aceti TaxID=1820010 RepID=A0ABQ1VNM2_9BACL|nr:sensor histidine kinase [Paenibacillus aceti]GGF83171.1 two-component sensor histidine kinase [Paenibacillus aceti]